ncbi:hypothetical protein RBH20_19730 [Haloarcula sp. H-GB4]|uniref:hypothetical protein n=1 Tax=Haloarcula sp. H-GB4 TaxID=3069755 RepID=UPI0027B2DDFC|nr:hypothetical protein [Haloarcula sp. H-GB4]MDQ2074761.1 hypothetical protein [Haloarcula sp. H-GB4]
MNYERSDEEQAAIEAFLSDYFPELYDDEVQTTLTESASEPREISDAEDAEIRTLLKSVDEEFGTSKGTLGLAIDFLMIAEQLSREDDRLSGFQPDIDRETILNWYENTAKTTLTPKYDGTRYGIRPVHNDVIELFRSDLLRTNFPSSPGHHTGEWERYDHMLESSFRLSSEGRHEAVQQVFDLGLDRLAARDFDKRDPPFPNPFVEVLNHYQRSHPDEEGGLTYQAMAYGYVRTNWSHLSFRASKVRTGSARQHRQGDIDGYYGPDLMLSVEVKDRHIDDSTVYKEFEAMMDLAERTNVVVVGICTSVTENAAATLEEAGVEIVTDQDLEDELQVWDYHKQNRAIQGMVHFLSSIEEDPAAVQRLLRFIQSVDPENPALAHLSD